MKAPWTCLRILLAATSLSTMGAATAFAAPTKFSGSFYCQPRQTWVFGNIPGVGMVPTTLKVIVPGAGYVSNMSGSVVCYSDDETIDLKTTIGTATYTLRDATGDIIVLSLDAMNMDPATVGAHSGSFRGTFHVVSGTGRFTGAVGAGTFQGWHDDDPPADRGGLPTTGLGYWEFEGGIDFTVAPDSIPIQLSSRAVAGAGANVAILGFQFGGSSARSFLIRGVGPGLAPLGVANPLSNPAIAVVRKNGEVVAANDDWSDQAPNATPASSLSGIATRVGAFPLPSASKDAALFVTLTPGIYTVTLSGTASTSGAALIEVYEVR